MTKISANFISKYLTNISLILLISYLCAFVSHAQHFDLVVDPGEAQQCQLCQNNIDTPPDLSLSVIPIYISIIADIQKPLSAPSVLIAHQRPPLRAPPVY